MRAASYVLPLKWAAPDSTVDSITDLAGYLRRLAGEVDDVIVVDGSAPEVYARHGQAWGRYARHLPPDPRLRFANGKVNGVVTGMAAARHDKVVLADDDVRYDVDGLDRVLRLLDRAELVRPQNVFDRWPWHARWDTARSLLNRAWTADYPGTFGLRRSLFLRAGGYDGDTLFENLEMIRTLKAHGAREVRPLDLFVSRAAPEADRFWNQRPRQAYDDFAQPGRLAVWLVVLPAAARALVRRRPRVLLAGAAATVALAETGRRRGGGRSVYPASTPLLAPVWVLERGTYAWWAMWLRLRHGGVTYAGRRIAVAAHSSAALRRRACAGLPAVDWLPGLARTGGGTGGEPSGVVDRPGPEADDPVGTVAEGLAARGPAAAQRHRAPPRVDLPPVRGDQPERPAHQQRPVLVRRDRRAVLGGRNRSRVARLLLGVLHTCHLAMRAT